MAGDSVQHASLAYACIRVNENEPGMNGWSVYGFPCRRLAFGEGMARGLPPLSFVRGPSCWRFSPAVFNNVDLLLVGPVCMGVNERERVVNSV